MILNIFLLIDGILILFIFVTLFKFNQKPVIMIKRKILLLTTILFSVTVFAQDIVVNMNGQRFDCYISREDISAVYFTYYRDGSKVDTSIVRNDIINYQYGAVCEAPIPKWDSKVAISAGYGIAGATYIGTEFEFLFSRRFGIQVGGGALGAGGGINYHFSPTIRSSYLSLQYNIQGIGNDSEWGYRRTTIGPSIVFRGRRWFTAQIGIGYILDKGPAYNDISSLPVALTVGIGAYIPL